VDFNTGTSSTGGSGGSSGGSGGGSRTMSGAPGGEFDYRDPVQSFVATVRSLATEPVAFFSRMLRQGDLVNPLIFAVICAEIAALLGGILAVLAAIVGIGTRTFGESLGAFLLSLVTTPIFAAIGLFIGAGILHLLVILIVKPVSTSFETTFRVVSYSSVSQLVSWIPVVGPIAGAVVSLVLGIFGIREAHSTTTGKAALVVLIPAAVALLLVLILVLAGMALFFSLR